MIISTASFSLRSTQLYFRRITFTERSLRARSRNRTISTNSRKCNAVCHEFIRRKLSHCNLRVHTVFRVFLPRSVPQGTNGTEFSSSFLEPDRQIKAREEKVNSDRREKRSSSRRKETKSKGNM